MKFSEIKSALSSATYVYANLTQADIDALTTDNYVSEINGVVLVGTNVPIEGFVEIEFAV